MWKKGWHLIGVMCGIVIPHKVEEHLLLEGVVPAHSQQGIDPRDEELARKAGPELPCPGGVISETRKTCSGSEREQDPRDRERKDRRQNRLYPK